jgi:hypothetical protein
MKHPWLIELEYYGGNGLGREVTLALQDKEALMDIGWCWLDKALPPFGDKSAGAIAQRAFINGWNHDEDTRQLRTMFQQMVYLLPDKDLEDYL